MASGFTTKKLLLIGGCVVLFAAFTAASSISMLKNSDVNKNNQKLQLLVKGSDVLDEVPLIDGHNDLPYNLYKLENNQINDFEFDSDLKLNPRWQVSSSFTDLPRLRLGKLKGQFWVAYVSCERNYKDAVERTIEQIDVIKRLVKKYPNDLMYVTRSDQIMEAFHQNKIASMIEIEGGHSLDSRLSVLRLYYDLGVRCMTMTHSCNTPWADASPIDDTLEPKRGLSEWGKKVLYEMNRLGIIADISHVSEKTMEDVLDNSEAPVIFTHSSVYSLLNHHRNVKDHVLTKLRQNGGVIMINFYSDYIGGANTIYDVINHINYVRDLIGSEHVGIGSDYDGVSRVPAGLEDVSKYPDLFDLLAEDGHDWTPWTADELKNLAGLNLIRVFQQVEAVRDAMKTFEILDDPIPYADIIAANHNVGECRTDIEKYRPTFKGSDVLNEVPLIDGHNDLPWNLYNRENNQLKNFMFDSNLKENPRWQISSSMTDLPRLRLGKLKGQFWVAYVSCMNNYKDAVERTIEQIDVIKRLAEKYSNDLMYVTEADQIMEAFRQNKIASMIEIEGGHSLDSRLSVLRLYYEMGVRCMTITHSCNTPWADASPIDDAATPKRNLTVWGKKVISEMNRLGMIADISHVSEGVMVDVLENSRAPVIFSHSSVYTLLPHHRNVKDHVLEKLKVNDGLIMINFYSVYIGGNNTIFDVINHINYVRNLIGVDHVGIGSDYDGVSRVPAGLEDVSKYPDLFDRLAESGHGYVPWTAEELKKLAGLNLIRVFKQVEAVRDSMINEKELDDPVPYADIIEQNKDAEQCRTDLNKYKPSEGKRLVDLLDVPPAEGF